MQALVLVGGEGTRLRPLTTLIPKPALPLVDRPFIEYMIEWLGSHGIDDVILAGGFKAEGLRAILERGDERGPRIRFLEEPEPRGTAGGIKFAEDLLGDRFCVLNGDVLTDLDLSALISQHAETGASATLGLYGVEDPSAYGLVRREDDGRITEFLEKPPADEIDTDEINAGMYVLERSVLDLIPSGQECSIERDVFPRLVGNGLFGRRLEGYWLDIGRPDTYLQAVWDILEGRVATSLGERMGPDGILVAAGAEVDPDALLAGPAVVLDGAVIGAGTEVGPRAVVGSGSQIGDDSRIRGSALHAGCRVGDGAVVTGSILGEGVVVDPGARVEDAVLVGEPVA